MDKHKRLIILSLLIVIVISVWAKGLKKPYHTPEIQEEEQPVIDIEKRIAKKSTFANWGRSPFILGGDTEIVSGLHLSGIIWEEQQPLAIINKQVLGIGDEIIGNRITDIQKYKVALIKDGAEFTLQLKTIKAKETEGGNDEE